MYLWEHSSTRKIKSIMADDGDAATTTRSECTITNVRSRAARRKPNDSHQIPDPIAPKKRLLIILSASISFTPMLEAAVRRVRNSGRHHSNSFLQECEWKNCQWWSEHIGGWRTWCFFAYITGKIEPPCTYIPYKCVVEIVCLVTKVSNIFLQGTVGADYLKKFPKYYVPTLEITAAWSQSGTIYLLEMFLGYIISTMHHTLYYWGV